jgi:hypothetical protein
LIGKSRNISVPRAGFEFVGRRRAMSRDMKITLVTLETILLIGFTVAVIHDFYSQRDQHVDGLEQQLALYKKLVAEKDRHIAELEGRLFDPLFRYERTIPPLFGEEFLEYRPSAKTAPD